MTRKLRPCARIPLALGIEPAGAIEPQSAQPMTVLVYKRTHPDDPDASGRFGVQDCMGRVRARRFDAVIGVGGISGEPRAHGIDGRLNWVGVGARRLPTRPRDFRGPIIAFSRFRLFEDSGPLLAEIAPALARHMYERNRRAVMLKRSRSELWNEVQAILRLARPLKVTAQKRAMRARGPCRPCL